MKSRQDKGRKCTRSGCSTIVFGQQQVCEACRAKDLICKTEGCGQSHGGKPGMTKFCPECRAKRRRKPHAKNNPPWTPEEDAIIRDVYANHHTRELGGILRAKFPGRPRWSITRRAQVLGAATVRTKEPRWTTEEDAIVKQWVWMTPERIGIKLRAAGFKRTVTAIAIRVKRMNLREHIDGVTAQGFAKLLGVDVHAVVRWIDQGKLQASRRAGTNEQRDRWYISTEAMRTFLIDNPEHVELSKLERVGSKMWFLELITNGRISEGATAVPATAIASGPSPTTSPDRTVPLCNERVTLTALAEICGRPVAELLHRIDGLGMSVDHAAFGAEEVPATVAGGPLLDAIGAAIRAAMRRHRAKPADMAVWTKLPQGFVDAVLAGRVQVVAPSLCAMVEILDCDLRVDVVQKPRSFEAFKAG